MVLCKSLPILYKPVYIVFQLHLHSLFMFELRISGDALRIAQYILLYVDLRELSNYRG